MQDDSLRERSKVRRRTAIKLAALRLFAAQGYDATTIADIADAAEVAPRTVTLYFPTKLEIALASSAESFSRLTIALRETGPDRAVLECLTGWLVAEGRETSPEERRLRAEMYRTNPFLHINTSTHGDEAAQLVVRAVAREIGVPEDHPAARIVLGCVIGALGQYELLPASGATLAAAQRAIEVALSASIAALARAEGYQPGRAMS